MTTSLRCLLVWLLTTAASATTVEWSLAAVDPTAAFDDLVVSLAAYALAACAAWAWLVCSVVVVRALAARGLSVPHVPGVPAWAARAVLAACGIAVLAMVPAHASTFEAPRPPTATLDGLPFPDRAVGPAHAGGVSDPVPPARADTPTPEPATAADAVGTVVVRSGDSLWRIASARLAPDAADAEVAAATAALHDLNRDVVGADPDLIHPGLRLRTPRV